MPAVNRRVILPTINREALVCPLLSGSLWEHVARVTRLCRRHFHINARSHRHGEVHKSTELDHYDSYGSGEQSFHRQCLLLVSGSKCAVTLFVGKTLKQQQGSKFWVGGSWASCARMMTRSFPGFPGLTQTHNMSKMHGFSEIMENEISSFDCFRGQWR